MRRTRSSKNPRESDSFTSQRESSHQREFPPKVPASEKLFPFPQPVGVSYEYVRVGVSAR
jgi:hypothetical protein